MPRAVHAAEAKLKSTEESIILKNWITRNCCWIHTTVCQQTATCQASKIMTNSVMLTCIQYINEFRSRTARFWNNRIFWRLSTDQDKLQSQCL